jgi:prepilin-type N-terminal cleavage/methylation domain-containing protein
LRRGYTILEFLVAAAIMALIAAATARAISSSLGYETKLASSRETAARVDSFEARMRTLISLAHLSSDAAATNSFFIASAGQPASGGAAQTSSSDGDADSLTFTSVGERLSGTSVNSDDDFETLNTQLGPQGGVAETTLSTTPYGDSAGKTGLFIRIQRPADGDPTQGGTERLLTSDVESTKYEFFDGNDWVTTWDTRTQATKRLPAAVRITYKFTDEENTRVMVVRIPESDVTTDNPISAGTA